MVDFKKKREAKSGELKIHPLDIYETLDRKHDKGPLRDVQKEILVKWFDEFQKNKDVILKLHTGQGKTIIGLLILQSKLNQGISPALYLCPNPYLVDQTCSQADSFGIKYCVIDDSKEIPDDFLNGKSILITSAQKLFNGLSKFGLHTKSIDTGAVILDDAHSCIEVIKEAFKIKVRADHPIHVKLLNLFSDDLKKQQAGTLSDINAGDYDALLAVPYWSWRSKCDDLLQIISEHKDDVIFGWNLLKNMFSECRCVFTGSSVEITPYNIPLETFGTYHKAKHRVFMSATLNDDSFFVTGLGLDENTIVNPLKLEDEKWSGEKLILIPSQIDDIFDRSQIVSMFGKPRKNANYGTVVMVPSGYEATDWKATGAFIPSSASKEFKAELQNFLSGNYDQTLVLINRYDGIDLADENCRILILCSVPFAGTLEERYIASCRSTSEQILLKTAQSIEQGFGRGVRGEKDFCCILLVGINLIKLIKSAKTAKFFSAQTQKQIEIGISVSKDIEKDIENGVPPEKAFLDVLHQQIDAREDEWKGYYADEMNEIKSSPKKNNVLSDLILERTAYLCYRKGDIEGAIKNLQSIADSKEISEEERGWYLQEMARYYCAASMEKSNTLQNSAYKLNYNLFKPFQGYVPKKINPDSVARNEKIIAFINKYESFFDLIMEVDTVLNNLVFESTSEVFEKSVEDLGKILGYESIRPDKENNEGPDNLWKIDNQQFLAIECKNRVDPNRSYIIRSEAGQMGIYINWFKQNYNSNGKYVMVYPKQKMLDKGVFFDEEVSVLRSGMLNKLKKQVGEFYKEFRKDNFNSLSSEIINKRLELHGLLDNNILNDYFEPILTHVSHKTEKPKA